MLKKKSFLVIAPLFLILPSLLGCKGKVIDYIMASIDETKSCYDGGTIDKSDIKVTATYTDKSSSEVNSKDWTSDDFKDTNTYTFQDVGEKVFTILYKEKTAYAKINVSPYHGMVSEDEWKNAYNILFNLNVKNYEIDTYTYSTIFENPYIDKLYVDGYKYKYVDYLGVQSNIIYENNAFISYTKRVGEDKYYYEDCQSIDPVIYGGYGAGFLLEYVSSYKNFNYDGESRTYYIEESGYDYLVDKIKTSIKFDKNKRITDVDINYLYKGNKNYTLVEKYVISNYGTTVVEDFITSKVDNVHRTYETGKDSITVSFNLWKDKQSGEYEIDYGIGHAFFINMKDIKLPEERENYKDYNITICKNGHWDTKYFPTKTGLSYSGIRKNGDDLEYGTQYEVDEVGKSITIKADVIDENACFIIYLIYFDAESDMPAELHFEPKTA